MKNNYQVKHYDGTISLHAALDEALQEASARLEPWRDESDRIARQQDESRDSCISRVLVVNGVGEPTDAASYIIPCGDWLDASRCLPGVNQRVLACWLEEGEPNDLTHFSLSETEFIRWALKNARKPTHAWWRPLPALPTPCQGATPC